LSLTDSFTFSFFTFSSVLEFDFDEWWCLDGGSSGALFLFAPNLPAKSSTVPLAFLFFLDNEDSASDVFFPPNLAALSATEPFLM
jgi:hypothetical protein